jgi:oxygen-independent coproporphyrinogen-3 oxidase
VEAGRPDTIDREKLSVLLAHGVNRISINPQTMNDETLRRMGRAHSEADTIGAFSMAREMGFSWINMDLIAGLPGESPADMAHSCRIIEELSPENLTVHALALKRSSGLKATLGGAALPSQQEAETMLRIGAETAASLNMQPYYMYRQKYMSGNLENVGYAKPDYVCRYNIDMMEEGCSILAHGAGAMTKRVFDDENRIERVPAPKDVNTYMQKLALLDEKKRAQFLD